MKTETAVQHTPTPWAVVGGEIGKQSTILCGNGIRIQNVAPVLADKIVTAVNSHADLLSALKGLKESYDAGYRPSIAKFEAMDKAIAKAEAV